MKIKYHARSWNGWMAVRPKTNQPWTEAWLYIRKTKPPEIERSGFKAIKVLVKAVP